MSNYYYWHKIPESAKTRVKDAVDRYDLDELLDIYYEFKLAPYKYCCAHDGMYRHFKKAIENNYYE